MKIRDDLIDPHQGAKGIIEDVDSLLEQVGEREEAVFEWLQGLQGA